LSSNSGGSCPRSSTRRHGDQSRLGSPTPVVDAESLRGDPSQVEPPGAERRTGSCPPGRRNLDNDRPHKAADRSRRRPCLLNAKFQAPASRPSGLRRARTPRRTSGASARFAKSQASCGSVLVAKVGTPHGFYCGGGTARSGHAGFGDEFMAPPGLYGFGKTPGYVDYCWPDAAARAGQAQVPHWRRRAAEVERDHTLHARVSAALETSARRRLGRLPASLAEPPVSGGELARAAAARMRTSWAAPPAAGRSVTVAVPAVIGPTTSTACRSRRGVEVMARSAKATSAPAAPGSSGRS